jgi:hypothetical protein
MLPFGQSTEDMLDNIYGYIVIAEYSGATNNLGSEYDGIIEEAYDMIVFTTILGQQVPTTDSLNDAGNHLWMNMTTMTLVDTLVAEINSLRTGRL